MFGIPAVIATGTIGMVEREYRDEQAEAILETACPSEDRAQNMAGNGLVRS